MADEEVKPVEEVTETPETPEPAQTELPLAAATEETAETVEAPAPEGDKPVEPVVEPPKEDWRDKELKAKHRKLKEAERALAEKEAEIVARDALLAKFNQGKTEEPKLVSADEVTRKAQELVAHNQYIENCNKAAAKGEETYKEGWKEAVSNLEILGGFDPQTMNGILATDDPAKVLFELGKNPEKYHSITSLPYERRIIEMGKIAMAPATKPVSNAPAPVSPVGGRAAPSKETIRDDMDDDQWFKIRRAQKLAKFKANNPGVRV